MVSFVSIMQLEEGRVSYRVSENKDYYRAELINSTSAGSFPGELKIDKPVAKGSDDSVIMNKLVQAIQNTEANMDDIN